MMLFVLFQEVFKIGVIDCLIDIFKYMGLYKERFDEVGKGKGVEGRVDKVDKFGYVGNYKGQGIYDEKY